MNQPERVLSFQEIPAARQAVHKEFRKLLKKKLKEIQIS
jgi:hypothetical protein